ncbi:MAG TPA: FecR family protein, partial [Desulfobaccales bacterium]|nr:FecR family protein [Desulfobaccales bacterium]
MARVILVLVLVLGLSAWASAKVVGHVTKVQGRIDILKRGKLPANPVKLQDAVESGDVLRAKSLSRAQITFIDNTILTLSPRSRLAIKDYEFHPEKEKRNAVLKIFQGLAHVVVSKLYKVEQPDFIIETNTAVTGVRGTDFGVRLEPNSTTILNFQGLVQVANIFPEVSKLTRRTAKVAFTFPPSSVLLHDMQATTVAAGLSPTVPVSISELDKKQFMSQMGDGLMSQKKSDSSEESPVGGNPMGAGSGQSNSGGGTAGTGGGVVDTGGGGGISATNLGAPDSSLTSMVSSFSSDTTVVPTITSTTGTSTISGTNTLTTLNTVTVPP